MSFLRGWVSLRLGLSGRPACCGSMFGWGRGPRARRQGPNTGVDRSTESCCAARQVRAGVCSCLSAMAVVARDTLFLGEIEAEPAQWHGTCTYTD